MGRKEFYEKLEELNRIRKKLIINGTNEQMNHEERLLLGKIDDELLHLKLLQ